MEFRAVVDESTSVVNLYQHQTMVAKVPYQPQADTWKRLLIDAEDYALSLWNSNGNWKIALYPTDERGYIRLQSAIPIRVEAVKSAKARPIL